MPMAFSSLQVPSGCSRGHVPVRARSALIAGPSLTPIVAWPRNVMDLITSLKSSVRSCNTSRRKRASFCVRAGIRAVESYDASFHLQPEADENLRNALSSTVFCAQVAEQSKKGTDVKYEFTGHIFQPVPWSPTTKHGMPVEFERYLLDKEKFTIVNVPPNFMFNAKIFKPSRLCAIFKRV